MAIWGGPLANGNLDALRLIASLSAVLAGFIIAVITASSNPKFLSPGNWRLAAAHRVEIDRAIWRYLLLFYAYLVTIGLAIATIVVKGTCLHNLAHWLERGTLSVTTGAVIWSFGLPVVIVRIRKAILDQEVENRKRTERTQRPPKDDR